ncbi:MAG TPA: tRNA CCA-pyrophosphorylase, partial [Burkholderiaceae bacterium]|nr:tRNA CCA-pyrophosphorylase [Burkholderiaceae bacterium]
MSVSPRLQTVQAEALRRLVKPLQTDKLLNGLTVYVVGGAVRDCLRGAPTHDRDWVVVGATPEQMIQRGFTAVGADFPVFLHPKTHEEFALARTERKSGRGYRGFTFYTGTDVTIEQDLGRRDLTINAMACDRQGRLIDPLGAFADLSNKVLRHVGQAFSEDPVRLLRLARFAARFADFSIDPQTLSLAKQLVRDGEVDELVAERVWAELSKGLMTPAPNRMLAVLQETAALERIAPGLIVNDLVTQSLNCAVSEALDLAQRFALLCQASPQAQKISQQLRASSECADFARLLPIAIQYFSNTVANQATRAEPLNHEQTSGTKTDAKQAKADAQLGLIERLDGLRRPERFSRLLQAASCVIPVDQVVWQKRL